MTAISGVTKIFGYAQKAKSRFLTAFEMTIQKRNDKLKSHSLSG